MALDTGRQVASATELGPGILPHDLEHAEAGSFACRLSRHERLVDQTTEHVDHVADPAHGAGGVEVEAAGKDSQATERDALVVEQEVVAPVEGGGQGPLAVRTAVPAAGGGGGGGARPGRGVGDHGGGRP